MKRFRLSILSYTLAIYTVTVIAFNKPEPAVSTKARRASAFAFQPWAHGATTTKPKSKVPSYFLCPRQQRSSGCINSSRFALPPKEEQNEDHGLLSSTESLSRFAIMSSAFMAENVFSYALAPGLDGTLFPQRDLDLIASLTDSNIMFSGPPAGYALFALLLFNPFIYLPFVWGGILYPEATNTKQILPAFPFIVLSVVFGFIGLYPYLAVRKPQRGDVLTQSSKNQSVGAMIFCSLDNTIAKATVVAVNVFLLYTFFQSMQSFSHGLLEEVRGFLQLNMSSQFVSTTTIDMIIGSMLFLDPIADDAVRREYIRSREEGFSDLLPFATPVIGPLMWFLVRPQINDSSDLPKDTVK